MLPEGDEKGLYSKIGAAITVGGARFGGQETAMRALHDIMLIHGIILVGDSYKEHNCGHHGARNSCQIIN